MGLRRRPERERSPQHRTPPLSERASFPGHGSIRHHPTMPLPARERTRALHRGYATARKHPSVIPCRTVVRVAPYTSLRSQNTTSYDFSCRDAAIVSAKECGHENEHGLETSVRRPATAKSENVLTTPTSNSRNREYFASKPRPSTNDSQRRQSMPSNTQHDIKVLNNLIETTIDSADGYGEAAKDAANTRFAAAFQQRAAERRDLTRRLQEQVRSLGGKPEADGTVLAKAHRKFVELR